MRILVVEDERKIARFVQKGLKEFGFAVEVIGRGDEALEIILDNPFEAIVLDIMLPGRRSSRSIFLAVITKRVAALPTIAVPRIIKHNGDGRAHPGEKCTLVCRMVAKISDHLCQPI